MNAITRTFSLHHTRAHQSAPRSIWLDTGVGLAIGLMVLLLAMVQVGFNPGAQSIASWPDATPSRTSTNFDNAGLPDRLPIDPLISDGQL